MEQQSSTESVHFATFDLDLRSGELRKDGRKIRLPHQSFRVLTRLLKHPGEPVTREELRGTLWPDGTFVDFEVGLTSAVKKLRDALGDSAENPRFVETLPRIGYRFIAPVNGRPYDYSTNIVTSPTAEPTSPANPSTSPQIVGWLQIGAYRLVGLIVIGGGLIAVLAWLIIAARNRDGSAGPASIESVAVSLLRNETGDPTQEYFAVGLTDALTTTLAERSGLRVMPRTSIPDYKASKKPLRVVGHEINLDAIVEWTVVRSKDRISVYVTLLDTRREQIILGRAFNGHVDDVVTLQEDVAEAIAQATGHKLSKPHSGLRVSGRAEDLYFRSLTVAGRETPQGFIAAIQYLDATTDEQPDFARAWATKAMAWNQFAFGGGLAPSDYFPKAESAARVALNLDESIPEAHAALALVLYRFYWDWAGADRELRRSLQLNPSANAHRMLAAFLLARGQPKDALEEAQRARDLDPLSPQALYNLGEAHREAGQNEQAMSEFRSLVQIRPEMQRAHWQLALCLLTKGDLSSAVNELQVAVNLTQRTPGFLAWFGYTHALMGHRAKAQEILNEVEALSGQKFVSPVDIAGLQIGLGLKDAALASLEKACEIHDPAVTRLLTDMRMASLRSDSRFQDLLRRVRLIK